MRPHPTALAVLLVVVSEVSSAATAAARRRRRKAQRQESEKLVIDDDEHWSRAFAAILAHESLDHIAVADWKSYVATPAHADADADANANADHVPVPVADSSSTGTASATSASASGIDELPPDVRKLWYEYWPGDGAAEPANDAGTNVADDAKTLDAFFGDQPRPPPPPPITGTKDWRVKEYDDYDEDKDDLLWKWASGSPEPVDGAGDNVAPDKPANGNGNGYQDPYPYPDEDLVWVWPGGKPEVPDDHYHNPGHGPNYRPEPWDDKKNKKRNKKKDRKKDKKKDDGPLYWDPYDGTPDPWKHGGYNTKYNLYGKPYPDPWSAQNPHGTYVTCPYGGAMQVTQISKPVCLGVNEVLCKNDWKYGIIKIKNMTHVELRRDKHPDDEDSGYVDLVYRKFKGATSLCISEHPHNIAVLAIHVPEGTWYLVGPHAGSPDKLPRLKIVDDACNDYKKRGRDRNLEAQHSGGCSCTAVKFRDGAGDEDSLYEICDDGGAFTAYDARWFFIEAPSSAPSVEPSTEPSGQPTASD